jgi:hypothetical protein
MGASSPSLAFADLLDKIDHQLTPGATHRRLGRQRQHPCFFSTSTIGAGVVSYRQCCALPVSLVLNRGLMSIWAAGSDINPAGCRHHRLVARPHRRRVCIAFPFSHPRL